MAVEVKFDLKTQQVSAYLKGIPGGLERAGSRALNSLISDIRNDAIKGVTSVYNIRSKDAGRNIGTGKLVRRSGPKSLFIFIKAAGGPIPLKGYAAQGGIPLGGRAPVTVEVRKGHRKAVGGAFIGPNGHVFARKGKTRKPIKKLMGPSLPSAFVKDVVTKSLIKTANRLLPVRIETEAVREIRKLATGKLPKL